MFDIPLIEKLVALVGDLCSGVFLPVYVRADVFPVVLRSVHRAMVTAPGERGKSVAAGVVQVK